MIKLHRFTRHVAATIIVALASTAAHSALLTLSFTDPVGDGYPALIPPETRIDLTGMQFTFDNITGDYEVIFTAVASKPFLGAFRLNVNLFNPDIGTTAEDPSFFSDTFNDFDLSIPENSIILTGTNSRLIAWSVGDRVAVSGPDPLGLPTGGNVLGFGSGVIDLGLTNTMGYFIGDDIDDGFTIVSAVPIPPALYLFGSGLLGLVGISRRRKTA